MSSSTAVPTWVAHKRRRMRLWLAAGLSLLVIGGWSGWSFYTQERQRWLSAATSDVLLAAARAEPYDADLAYHAALALYYQDGKPAEALPLAKRAIELDPSKPMPHLLLGYLLTPTDRPAEALLHFERACALDKSMAKAHDGAGQFYLELDMPQEALKHFQAAWNPAKPEVSVCLGLIDSQFRAGYVDEAEKLCRASLEWSPPSAVEGYLLLHKILKHKGQPEGAVSMMFNHLAESRFGLETRYVAQTVLAMLERPNPPERLTEVERHTRRALKRDSATPSGHEALGAILATQGRHEEAVGSLQQALKLDSRLYRARSYLARSLRALGREDEAARYDPPKPTAQQAQLIAELQRQVDASPAAAEPRLALATALESAGDPAAAFRATWPLMEQGNPEARVLDVANRTLKAVLTGPKKP